MPLCGKIEERKEIAMIQGVDLKPYLDNAILELGGRVKVSEEAVLKYLSTIVVVDDSLDTCSAKEIDQWFTANHYNDPYLKKNFESLSAYLNEYAFRYVKEMGCNSMIMQKEDEEWMNRNKEDFNRGFALLD